MSNLNDTEYTHTVYKNNPLLFKSYINKHVIITADDSSVHQGIVYTVDPVSESVILLEPDNDGKFNGKIIIGHSIRNIEVTTTAGIDLPDLFPAVEKKLTAAELTERREKIKQLLTTNLLNPVENNGVLEIQGMFSIEPPYERENCICTNPVVMSRLLSIIFPDSIS
ncbi:gem-associated protein 6-like [Microplitis demolitor]|uniref:gem-associated protein 6-like n=1 Tax=Microplitis demolitor TaxID=69319 RepID=UPI0004CCDC8D|nr:gem-associated protein 6-like [Microplitis demolitor]